MIERFNRTCLMMLSMFVNDRRDNWHEFLPYVMHAYPTSVHESTGYSPFRLMMGEECLLPQDVSTAELRTNREHDILPHPFATWVFISSGPRFWSRLLQFLVRLHGLLFRILPVTETSRLVLNAFSSVLSHDPRHLVDIIKITCSQ